MKNRSRTLGDSSASWNQGKAPDDWKEANVSPIFKKGDKRNCSNQMLMICSRSLHEKQVKDTG